MKIEVWAVSTTFDDGTDDTWIELKINKLKLILNVKSEWTSDKGWHYDLDAYEPPREFWKAYKDGNFHKGFHYTYLGRL